MPIADRVNLGLGGTSGQPHREQTQKHLSRHDMAHWKILKGAKGSSTHGHDTTKILAVSLSGVSGRNIASRRHPGDGIQDMRVKIANQELRAR